MYEVEGRKCKVRYVNAGKGWLFPVEDDPDNRLIARHIAFARINPDGKIERI